MNCMKCGVEVPEGQVFCGHCQEVMKEYPIKPGTHIHLPKRAGTGEDPRRPAKKKRTLSQEEQISQLRQKLTRLRILAVALVFALFVAGGFLAMMVHEDLTASETGRNYTIDTSMN